ncbi:hypothetical protein AB6884_03610 [Carnobacterium maltaromaticum]|uniref:hypothetical protein n=1 Tax=Carnobacterium maltaromaticum TaxID=2751 RepID=UPI0039BE5907
MKKQKLKKITELVDRELDEFIDSFDGVKIQDIRMALKEECFELNLTKRKLVEVLEEKLSQKINEQNLSIKDSGQLKKYEDELVFLTETENSIKRYTISDLIKDSVLTFVLGIAVGCMLFQLGIELWK